jgi:TMEM175 potassium channel family protein
VARCIELCGQLSIHRNRLGESPSSVALRRACDATPDLGELAHLFMVSLVPFSTAWVANSRLAAVPVFVYAAVFVLVNLAYCAFVWEALAQAEVEAVSARMRRITLTRSFLTLGMFVTAMLLSLKFPLWGFGSVCCVLLVYLRPEFHI